MTATFALDTQRLASPSLVTAYAAALAAGNRDVLDNIQLGDATDLMLMAGDMGPDQVHVIVDLAKTQPELARGALDIIDQWLLGAEETYDREPLVRGIRDIAVEYHWTRAAAMQTLVRQVEQTPNSYIAKIAGDMLDVALPNPDLHTAVTDVLFDKLETINSQSTEVDVQHICDALARLDKANKDIGIQNTLREDIEHFGSRIRMGVCDILLMTLGRMRATNAAPITAPAP